MCLSLCMEVLLHRLSSGKNYLQTTAAHCIHDGGIVNDFVWYPSIHCSQH